MLPRGVVDSTNGSEPFRVGLNPAEATIMSHILAIKRFYVRYMIHYYPLRFY